MKAACMVAMDLGMRLCSFRYYDCIHVPIAIYTGIPVFTKLTVMQAGVDIKHYYSKSHYSHNYVVTVHIRWKLHCIDIIIICCQESM